VREALFDGLILLGELHVDLHKRESALENGNEALTLAENLVRMSPGNVYPERCLAIAMQKLAEFHSYVAIRAPAKEKATAIRESDKSYSRALSIWSRWRTHNLAVPYSTNRESEIGAALASIRKPSAGPGL
jgi:hypothetical protein